MVDLRHTLYPISHLVVNEHMRSVMAVMFLSVGLHLSQKGGD